MNTKFSRKSKLLKEYQKLKPQLSKNEYELILYLISICDMSNLQAKASLKQIRRKLNIAINTIKSCRERLQEYELITYNWEENQVTVYTIRNLIQFPLETLSKTKTKNRIKKQKDDPVVSYLDFDYSSIPSEYKASFITYIKALIESGAIVDQAYVDKLFSSYYNVILKDNEDMINDAFYGFAESELKREIGETYKFDLMDEDLHGILIDILWLYKQSGQALSQRELENQYMDALVICERDISRMLSFFERVEAEMRQKNTGF